MQFFSSPSNFRIGQQHDCTISKSKTSLSTKFVSRPLEFQPNRHKIDVPVHLVRRRSSLLNEGRNADIELPHHCYYCCWDCRCLRSDTEWSKERMTTTAAASSSSLDHVEGFSRRLKVDDEWRVDNMLGSESASVVGWTDGLADWDGMEWWLTTTE